MKNGDPRGNRSTGGSLLSCRQLLSASTRDAPRPACTGMSYRFVPMTRAYAQTLVQEWRYEGELEIYDYSHEASHILDPCGWGIGVFAVLNQAGELVGELSCEFIDENDRYTEYEEYDNGALTSSRQLWIGFGMRPDLTGRGLGRGFVSACVAFAVQRYHYRGEYVRLGVAAFNQRAIRVYEAIGFEVFEHTVGEIGGKRLECLLMTKRLQPSAAVPQRQHSEEGARP